MEIERGTLVEATTAGGTLVRMRALGAPTMGRDFLVVQVCTEQEWERAEAERDTATGIPWPVEALSALEPA